MVKTPPYYFRGLQVQSLVRKLRSCMPCSYDQKNLGGASQVVPVVKNQSINAGDVRDEGSIPGLGRSPGGGMVTHFSILAWRIPWTEETGGLLQSTRCF